MPVVLAQFGAATPSRERSLWPRLRGAGVVLAAAGLVSCAELPTEADAGGGAVAAPVAVSPPTAPPEAAPAAAGEFPPGVLYQLLVAELAGRRGRVGLAVDNYLAAARATRDPEIVERATRVAVFARDQAKSLEAAELWVEVAPKSLDAQRVNAALLLRAGRADDAVARLGEIIEGWNEPPGRGFGIVSDMLSRERDREAALAAMKRLVADNSGDADAQFALARLTTRFGLLDQSVEVLERALELEPKNIRLIVLYARVLRSQEKTEAALEFLRESLGELPDAYAVRLAYARLLADAERYEEARSQFQELVDVRPDDADVRFALGLLLLQVEDYPAARTEFESLLALGQRKLSAYYYLGQIAEAEKELDRALASYRRVDRGNHYLDAQVRIAFVFAEQGNLERARGHLQSARRRSPADDIRLYRAEAELLVRAERHDEAIRVYDSALEEYPEDGDLLYGRAMVAARIDRIDILERDLRDILSREPDNADALNALGYTLADRTDRYEEAMVLVKRALELKPNDYYIMDSMGWVLYRLGRYEEAVIQLQNAMSIREDAEVAAHLGEVLWVLGRRDEARAVLETALEQAPDDKRLRETLERLTR